MMFAYTLTGEAGRGACWTSGAGSRRAGSVSAGTAACGVVLGAVHTTANTTAEAMRTGRYRTTADSALLVGKIFKLGRELTHPPPVVEAANKTTITLVARDVHELLLSYQRPQPGQVRISAVAHDASDHARKLPPLAFGERFSIAGDGHQQRRGGAGDGLGQELFRLGAGDDLAPRADDVGNPVPAHPDDVAPAADSRAFEVSGSCFHAATEYCN